MMTEKISDESRENFEKVESDLFSVKDRVKYTPDNEIESQVRYGYLCDVYGSDYVDLVLKDLDINMESLCDFDKYSEVLSKLNV